MKKYGISILNVRIDNYDSESLLVNLKRGVLVTPNVDDIVKQQRDEEFHKYASLAEYSVCDSHVLYLCSRLLGHKLKSVISGSSFFPKYCEYHAHDENIKIFLLGAKMGVAEVAAKKINEKIGRRIIVGTYSPPFGFERDEVECKHIVDILSDSEANVVLVGLGNPKQTKWIYQYKDSISNVDLYMALGATIDFEAGNIKRAPKIFQKLALEWLFRMCCDPHRLIKRYLKEDLVFFWLLFKQMIGIYKDPFESDKKLDNDNKK